MQRRQDRTGLAVIPLIGLLMAGCAATVEAPPAHTRTASFADFSQYGDRGTTDREAARCNQPGGLQGNNGYHR